MAKTAGINIVFGRMDPAVREVLSYLLLIQNRLQSTFEFRIVESPPADPLIESLNSSAPINAAEIEAAGNHFAKRMRESIDARAIGFRLRSDRCDAIVLLSDKRLIDNFYYVGGGEWTVIALGNWQSELSPPSIIEYYLTFTIVAALDAITPDLKAHFETRGCALDFNATLTQAKFSVLSGYLCPICVAKLEKAASQQAVADTRLLLARDWLGDQSKPSDIAITAKKLGFDLFRTTGIKPTLKERLVATLEQEGLKNFLNISFQILLAVALVVLGLRQK